VPEEDVDLFGAVATLEGLPLFIYTIRVPLSPLVEALAK
jgi:hypothetical protein